MVYSFFAYGGTQPIAEQEQDDLFVGYTFADLYSWAQGLGAAEQELRATLDLLTEDGFLYSTVDDEHFKVTTV